MLYLLTLGWPWFVSAAALGLIVGVATKPPKASFKANIGFALLGAAALLLLAAALSSEKFQGREALTLEFALLAGAAYVARRVERRHVQNRRIGPRDRQAQVATCAHPHLALPRWRQGPRRRAGVCAIAASRAGRAKKAKRTWLQSPRAKSFCRASGPKRWRLRAPAPRTISRRSRVLDPRARPSSTLSASITIDQIAEWSLDNARWIGAALATPGRIERGKWIQQARELVAHQHQSPTE